MTRGTMRSNLRRRLQEPLADYWTDAELNQLINDSMMEVQKRVLAVQPEFILYDATIDVVLGQKYYAKPDSFFYERGLYLLNTTTSIYTRLQKKDFTFAMLQVDSPTAEDVYAHSGQYFYVSPTPPANVTAGIKCEYVPIIEVADGAAGDLIVPALPIFLHSAVVLQAQIYAAMETGDETEKLEASFEKEANSERIASFLSLSAADNEELNPEIVKGYS